MHTSCCHTPTCHISFQDLILLVNFHTQTLTYLVCAGDNAISISSENLGNDQFQNLLTKCYHALPLRSQEIYSKMQHFVTNIVVYAKNLSSEGRPYHITYNVDND